jgi:tetraacyldisaccharide-1-P 4'-kinase
VEQLGATVVRQRILGDHAAYGPALFKKLVAGISPSSGIECLVTTEKDFVKLSPALWMRCPLPIYAVVINIEFTQDGGERLDRFLKSWVLFPPSESTDANRQVSTH